MCEPTLLTNAASTVPSRFTSANAGASGPVPTTTDSLAANDPPPRPRR